MQVRDLYEVAAHIMGRTQTPARKFSDLIEQGEYEVSTSTVIAGTGIKSTSFIRQVSATHCTVLALLFFSFCGFGLRAHKLGAIGFAEDEMNKLEAVEAYKRGDISANAEHPMLMKLLMMLTVNVARSTPEGSGLKLSDETALRLPNALFGTLTLIPLFLLTASLFDRLTGLLAAGFWAFSISAITINRIGKEDTLLVFFMLLAFYFYVRAKQITPCDPKGRRPFYVLSAISFGLMLASKYFPHYFGLNALFHHNFHIRKREPGDPGGKAPALFFLVIPIAFLIANPAVLLPQVWSYLIAYMGEKLLVHTGYLFAGELYRNQMSASPFWGMPIYFYVLFMAIKIPLVELAAFLVGLVVAFRRWRTESYMFVLLMFILWIVPYSLAGSKWLRYTLSLMPFFYMLAAIGVVEIVRSIVTVFPRLKTEFASAMAVLIFLGLPALTAYGSGPHYALYTNPIGAGKAGYYFPHDEFYDDGLREAIRFVCDSAPEGATIAHETPAVVRYYLKRFNRNDLESRAISAPDVDPAVLSGPTYFIVQRGRIYFENRDKLDYISGHFQKVHVVTIGTGQLIAAEVFVSRSGSFQSLEVFEQYHSSFATTTQVSSRLRRRM